MLRGFRAVEPSIPTALPAATLSSQDFRQATEQVLLEQAASGEGVILGRAATIVLRGNSNALRVRLDGPREARIEQAMRLGDIDRTTAERALDRLDRTHADYARDLYGVEITDPSNFHLMIDSTAISLEACVDVILLTAQKGAPHRERAGAQE
jgi:cytidylate kinase